MSNILLKIISFYQKIPGNFHYNCKYYPTCSNYAKQSIEKYGALLGSLLTIKRLLKCNPFSKGGYDPVPERRKR